MYGLFWFSRSWLHSETENTGSRADRLKQVQLRFKTLVLMKRLYCAVGSSSFDRPKHTFYVRIRSLNVY